MNMHTNNDIAPFFRDLGQALVAIIKGDTPFCLYVRIIVKANEVVKANDTPQLQQL